VADFISGSDYNWSSDVLDDLTSVLWTKEANALPVTSTQVEYEPCMNPSETSLAPGYEPFKAEYPPSGCSTSVTNGLKFDPRYYKAGM
jgi:hypothetical protein